MVSCAVAAMVLLGGCSVPLTPATAPMAGLYWGSIAGMVIDEARGPAPPVTFHAEAGPPLTRDALAAGSSLTQGAPVQDVRAWLVQRGLTLEQLEHGEVLVARVGWIGDAPGTRRAVELPVLRGPLDVAPGYLLEVRIGPAGPAMVVGRRPDALGAQGCVYRALPSDAAGTERLNGRLLGAEGMRSVLECAALHTALWQRAAIFWHLEPKPAWWRVERAGPDMPTRLDSHLAPMPLALVAVYRNVSTSAGEGGLPIFVDGQPVGELRNRACMLFALPAGRHSIMTGTGGFFGSPRREIALQLEAGGQAPVEFVVDDAVNENLWLGLIDYRSYEQRAFRLVERAMLTAVSGCKGVQPLTLPGALPAGR